MLVAFSSSIMTVIRHWYCSLFYLGKNNISQKWSPTSCPATEAAVFEVWPIIRKLIFENVTTIVANVTAKEAVNISYKIKEMHVSLKFKYTQANVSQENDKEGEKPLTSHYSKGNSGK